MRRYKTEILNLLIDKYENSKSFIGSNTKKQSFSIQLEKEFPEYSDDSYVEEIKVINETVEELESDSLVKGKRHKNGILYAVTLNDEYIDTCYKLLRRMPKKETNIELEKILSQYQNSDDVVGKYAHQQVQRIKENKKVEYFSGDLLEYEYLLKALSEITKVKQETYIRDFSIKVLGDSKRFEKMKNTICSILFEYGNFPEKDTILQDLNIIKNPGHVYFKGAGIIELNGQKIDLNLLNGDIAISSSILKTLNLIKVNGDSVVTIENLTTFNMYKAKNEFVIYLGGYHNQLRREFIKRLYSQNPSINYYHYGDIDAGGFYILLHLREKTGVPFKPLNMDIKTLSANLEHTKKLTENDEKRLKNLLGTEFDEVIRYMLENNCKLEQEALD